MVIDIGMKGMACISVDALSHASFSAQYLTTCNPGILSSLQLLSPLIFMFSLNNMKPLGPVASPL